MSLFKPKPFTIQLPTFHKYYEYGLNHGLLFLNHSIIEATLIDPSPQLVFTFQAVKYFPIIVIDKYNSLATSYSMMTIGKMYKGLVSKELFMSMPEVAAIQMLVTGTGIEMVEELSERLQTYEILEMSSKYLSVFVKPLDLICSTEDIDIEGAYIIKTNGQYFKNY